MKILVTGVCGQLGHDVTEELLKNGIEAIPCDREEFDLTDKESTQKFILENKPEGVIHCAAYTAVDKAEDEEEICRKINAEGSLYIAEACEKIGAKMIYISTDYVFGGDGEEAYEPSDEKNPRNVYGVTKLEGEKNALENCSKTFVVRTSWVYGINGNNFVKTMRRLAETKDELNVVADQIGSPTYTKDLSVLLVQMIQTEKYGVYHATNEGFMSWAEFAESIMKKSGLSTKINHIPTSEYPVKAKRPLNSRLSKKCLTDKGFSLLPTQDDALTRYIEELNKQ
ncbi:MAG: dTDP-4-dehydrorhamnose reductase [Ruminococcaceae bacterium]|nr:dTDP-4-dehydrorhamnose reductase [Oscillospiraceae bacterium]